VKLQAGGVRHLHNNQDTQHADPSKAPEAGSEKSHEATRQIVKADWGTVENWQPSADRKCDQVMARQVLFETQSQCGALHDVERCLHKEKVTENNFETRSMLDCLAGHETIVDQSSSMKMQSESFNTLHRRPLTEATHKLAAFQLEEQDVQYHNLNRRDPAFTGTAAYLMSEVRSHDLRSVCSHRPASAAARKNEQERCEMALQGQPDLANKPAQGPICVDSALCSVDLLDYAETHQALHAQRQSEDRDSLGTVKLLCAEDCYSYYTPERDSADASNSQEGFSENSLEVTKQIVEEIPCLRKQAVGETVTCRSSLEDSNRDQIACKALLMEGRTICQSRGHSHGDSVQFVDMCLGRQYAGKESLCGTQSMLECFEVDVNTWLCHSHSRLQTASSVQMQRGLLQEAIQQTAKVQPPELHLQHELRNDIQDGSTLIASESVPVAITHDLQGEHQQRPATAEPVKHELETGQMAAVQSQAGVDQEHSLKAKPLICSQWDFSNIESIMDKNVVPVFDTQQGL